MKRSELLRQIEKEMWERLGTFYDGNSENVASVILKKLEDAGMTPPLNKDEKHLWEEE